MVELFSRPDLAAHPLRLAECSHAEALHAARTWHYSGTLPSCSARWGVWEGGQFRGAVTFGVGATPYLAGSVGVDRRECLELTRVALAEHGTPTTRIVRIALNLTKRKFPAVRVIVSFADGAQGHRGTIYEAGNWLHLGERRQKYMIVAGKLEHPRSLVSRYGTHSLRWLRENVDEKTQYVDRPPKRKFAFPFCAEVKQRLLAFVVK